MASYDDLDYGALFSGLRRQQAPEPTDESRGVFRGAADLGLEVASGVTRGVGMLANAFGANNAVSRGTRSADEFIREYLSAQSKEDSARAAEILAAAEDEGIGAQVVAGLRAFGQAPLSMLANTVGMAAPVVATALIPGVNAAAAGTRAAAMAGVGGAQGAGAVKGAIFEGVKSTEEQAGTSPEEAERIAEQAQSYTGPNALSIAGGAALGGLSAATGFQPAAARAIARRTGMLSLPTEQLEQSLLRRMSQGAAVEGATEFAQGGQEQYAVNVALQREGFDVPTFRGVVSQGTMEAVAGGALGAGFAAIDRPEPRATVEDIGKAPTIDAAIKAAQDVVLAPPDAQTDAPTEPQDPLAARFQALQQSLADPALRETIRANLGEEALSEATYYAGVAARTDEKLPEKTRARMMDLAEAIVQRATVMPVQNQAAIGSQVGAPGLMLTGPAGGGGGGGMLGLPAPTTPPVLMADAQGNVAPQPAVARTEALNRDFAAQQEAERVRLQQQELGKQTPRGQEPPERFAPIPAGEATEFDRVPVGEASELIPTGDVIEDVAPLPTGEATVLPDDMLTGDGMPYGTKSGANMRARKEGLGPANVVEIPGAGWVVRPQPTTMGQPGREVQPTNTRGTSAADVLRGPDAADAAGNGSPGAVDPRRGDGGELLREQQRADVAGDARGPDEQGVGGLGAAGLGTRGDAAPDDALTAAPEAATPGGFDPEAWQKARDDRIKASRDAGNTHLDKLEPYVETMRGKVIRSVHDPKVTGRVLSVDNSQNVYIEWTDSYSQEKEGAVPMQYGKERVMQTTLGPRDWQDYVVADASSKPPTLKERLAARQAQAQGAPAPTAPGVESSTAPVDAQDRGGLRAEDRRLREIDSSASELSGQMQNDVIEDDFEPSEVMPALRKWAADAKLPADELRQAVIKRLNASDMKAADRRKLIAAMDPTKPPAAPPRVYKTKTAASMARKQAGNTKRLKKVKGGFILREATDKEMAAAARAGRRLASGGGVDVENDSLLTALSKIGGLAMKERSDTIGEGNRNVAGKMLFRMTGKPLDRAIEELLEYGYIPAGEARSDPSRWLREAIKLEYLGTKQYFSDQGTEWMQTDERSVESLSDDELADLSAYDLEQSGYNSAPPEVQALTERLLAEAEALGIDTEAIREDAARQTQDLSQTDYELAVQEALTAAIARVAADAEGRNAGTAPAGGRDRGEADGGQDQGEEGLTLEAQDAEGLREKTEREARAAADDAAEQRRLERKAQADAQRDEFTLTGSDRPADVAAAAGQGGLFDSPTRAEPEAPPAATKRPEALIALRKRESVLKSLKECLAS